MTRIVAGRGGGRRLRVPPNTTRPTSSRVREALFSALEHRLDRSWSEVAVLDAFAGSGAMGLEAWSRGSDEVVLIENDRRAVQTITRNIADLGAHSVLVLRADTWKIGERAAVAATRGPFHVLILDPPYADSDVAITGLLARLQAGNWLADGCVAVVERAARGAPWTWPTPWQELTDRRYADTRISIGFLVASR